VVAKFDQRQSSSDGGAILLKAAEQRLGLTSALAAGLRDDRQAGKVQHELRELITQRVMALALGYEDANDAARLASDPIHKLLVGRDPVDGEDLASQPTLSRFENTPNRKEDDGSPQTESGDGRKNMSKAIAESPTARSPGPRPPKRLLTIMASRKHEDGASKGPASATATAQAITANP